MAIDLNDSIHKATTRYGKPPLWYWDNRSKGVK